LACSPDEETDDEEKPVQRRAEQIICILKEHQAGLGAKELCRKHGLSDATFSKRRSRYGGMEVSDARRLKALEAENTTLKEMLGMGAANPMRSSEPAEASEARFEAACRGLGYEGEELFAAASLCAGRDRPAPVSAAANPAGGPGIA